MIYKIFHENVETHPDKIAIVTSSGKKLTYRDVNKLVKQWANYFLDHDIQEGDRLGALLDDEDQHIFIHLALDRINATYVPFDAAVPKLQLGEDLKTLNLKTLIVEDQVPDKSAIDISQAQISLSASTLQEINQYNDAEPNRIYQETHLQDGSPKISYILSSSGQTGPKKWMPILASGLKYWAEVESELFVPYPSESILCTIGPAFDARTFEGIHAFATGAELHLTTNLQRRDLSAILDICKERKIECIVLISSQLDTQNTEKLIASLSSYGLKHLMVTGDKCSLHLKKLCKKYNINLWNCYGPTEATFGLSICRVNDLDLVDDKQQEWVPIGKPQGDVVKYHIIDEKLYIESPFLTPGYINNDEANKTAFRNVEIDGVTHRLFDTGDRFQEEQGYLRFFGRYAFDGHCKVSGVKVTPDIVKDAFDKFKIANPEDTFEVAVVIKDYLGKDKPYAYLRLPKDWIKKDGKIDKEKEEVKIFFGKLLAVFNGYLSNESLPKLINLDKLPIDTNNKIAYKQLIQREDDPDEFIDINSIIAVADNSTLYYQAVKQIWQEMFPGIDISGETEFRFLGDSSDAVEMVEKIKDRINPDYSFQDFLRLERNTLAKVAESVSQSKSVNSNEVMVQLLSPKADKDKNIILLPALLGEGNFSYKLFAQSMLNHKANIYGLSDPGILDAEFIPKSMDAAVDRYIAAIKKIQQHGRYHLMGFSFGATLAAEVALKLQQQGEEIEELHLVDGFPPLLYQSMSDAEYALVLQDVIKYIVEILNDKFFQEKIEPFIIEDLNKLSKIEQVNKVFSLLLAKVQYNTTKNMLQLAQQHLIFVLQAKVPEHKSTLYPVFYLSSPMLSPIRLSKNYYMRIDANNNLYFWNHYFEKVERNADQANCDHLGVLKSAANAAPFWRRPHEHTYNFQGRPMPFYRLYKDANGLRLAVFLVKNNLLESLVKELKSLDIDPKVQKCDQINETADWDQMYTSLGNIFCSLDESKVAAVTQLLQKYNICQDETESEISLNTEDELLEKNNKVTNVYIKLSASHFLLQTYALQYHGVPEVLIKNFNLKPNVIGENYLIYNFEIEEVLGSPLTAEKPAKFLANLMQLINCLDNNPQVMKKLRADYPSFFKSIEKQSYLAPYVGDIDTGPQTVEPNFNIIKLG